MCSAMSDNDGRFVDFGSFHPSSMAHRSGTKFAIRSIEFQLNGTVRAIKAESILMNSACRSDVVLFGRAWKPNFRMPLSFEKKA